MATERGMLKEALYYETEGGVVRCLLCPKHCSIAEGKTGFCRVRRHEAGHLYATTYGRVTSVNLDPIEKKPLFHFYPGSSILSLGTVGCNLSCLFCQNWEISQQEVPTQALSPEQAVDLARRYRGNIGIAFTYNEPLIWYEYVLDTAIRAREHDLKVVLVTNGMIEEPPLRELLPRVDALNVDVKAMTQPFYGELCRGDAAAVRRTVEICHAEGKHVELTNLVIPNWNDTDDDFRQLVNWAADLSVDLPLHFSRYHPAYRLTEPATPMETLLRARGIGQERLHYVYVGNVSVPGGEDTICPGCGRVAIARRGFMVVDDNLVDSRCRSCDTPGRIIGTVKRS
jgi:pyruvate formate lyase activating enzyme